ncbi:YciI family protein [Actinacidiphila yeochonensis]|uniref:YciI family protein n=1 Tax=Actinacidiphila yeochonensis TaxID=89050 RepID=UPI00055F7E8C|nr:YciI family protein [Actinacidiphila yeochonensis]
MAHYLLLINDNEADGEAADEAAIRARDDAHDRWRAEHKDVLVYTAHLRPSSTATTVREDVRGGFLVTDGPYAETKEALGGFYVIDVPDLDAALAAARRLPYFGRVGDAAVEVRPMFFAG